MSESHNLKKQTTSRNLNIEAKCQNLKYRKHKKCLLRILALLFTDTKEVVGRLNDPFYATVSNIMKQIENRMRESPYAVELTSDEPNRLQAPPDQGSDRYTQWINALEKPVARIPQQDYRRFFVACQRHLEVTDSTIVLVVSEVW